MVSLLSDLRHKPKPKEINFDLSPKQNEALSTLELPEVAELLYGGAKGGGKSILGCIFSYVKSLQLAAFWELQIRKQSYKDQRFTPVVGFMGRRRAVDFEATTLRSFTRIIPPNAYTIRPNDRMIIVNNAVAIMYGGLDDPEVIQKFNSAEFAFIFIDQAEECTQEQIGTLRGTLRLTMKGRVPSFKLLLTANPRICFLRDEFIQNPRPDQRFIPAKYTDNPFLPPNYGEQLDRAYGFNPSLLAALKEGSWDGLDQAYVVIRRQDVLDCVKRQLTVGTVRRKVTVADIAGESEESDETVIYDADGPRILDQEIYVHRDLMDTVGRILAHARKNESNLICVDRVGEGAGVWSRLCEVLKGDRKIKVYGYDGRISPPSGAIGADTYLNYRSYAWFKAAHHFRALTCSIPNDYILINQLSSATFHYTSGEKRCLDPKEDIRERLGKSPDRADAYVMLLDALDKVEAEVGSPVHGKSYPKYKRRVIPGSSYRGR